MPSNVSFKEYSRTRFKIGVSRSVILNVPPRSNFNLQVRSKICYQSMCVDLQTVQPQGLHLILCRGLSFRWKPIILGKYIILLLESIIHRMLRCETPPKDNKVREPHGTCNPDILQAPTLTLSVLCMIVCIADRQCQYPTMCARSFVRSSTRRKPERTAANATISDTDGTTLCPIITSTCVAAFLINRLRESTVRQRVT